MSFFLSDSESSTELSPSEEEHWRAREYRERVAKSKRKAHVAQRERETRQVALLKRIRRSYAEYKRAHYRGDLCHRCAGVNWSLLLPNEVSYYCEERVGLQLFGVPESSQELSMSPCSLCRFLCADQSFDKDPRRALRLDCACWGLRRWDADSVLSHRELDWTHHTPRLTFTHEMSTRNVSGYILQHAFPANQSYLLRKLSPELLDYGTLRYWLKRCKRQHSTECNPSFATTIPGLRVFDCHAKKVIDAPEDATFRYIALSYVWGGVKISEKEQARFPTTIRDAITVTIALGYRYLWVDQICIHQLNEAHKQAQIKLMGRIYAESELVIIAASGDSSDYGLAGVSFRHRQAQRKVELDTNVELIEMIHPNTTLGRTTWATRGWTLQEGYLATRRLVFTDKEVSYVCDCGTWQESVRRRGVEDLVSHSVERFVGFPLENSLENRLAEVLSHYSTRKLSVESDILNACMGILETLVDLHFWGMAAVRTGPTSRYPLSFSWFNIAPGQRREGFPTWSWAATTGPKHIPIEARSDEQNFVTEILTSDRLWLTPESHIESRYDRLLAGGGPTLRLIGSFYTGSLEMSPTSDAVQNYGEEREGKSRVVFQHPPCEEWNDLEFYSELQLDNELTNSTSEGTVKAVLLNDVAPGYEPIFMILQAVGDHYVRIGVTSSCWARERKTGLISYRNGLQLHPDCISSEEVIYIE